MDFSVSLTSKLRSNNSIDGGILYIDGECPGENNVDNQSGKQAYYDEPERRGIRFKAGVKVETDGKVKEYENTLEIKEASYAYLYFTAETSFNGFDRHPYSMARNILSPAFQDLRD